MTRRICRPRLKVVFQLSPHQCCVGSSNFRPLQVNFARCVFRAGWCTQHRYALFCIFIYIQQPPFVIGLLSTSIRAIGVRAPSSQQQCYCIACWLLVRHSIVLTVLSDVLPPWVFLRESCLWKLTCGNRPAGAFQLPENASTHVN
jgi:hypothetical protein